MAAESFRTALRRLASGYNLSHAGAIQTSIAGVRLFRIVDTIERTSIVYQPSIVLIAEGRKTGYLDGHQYDYGEDALLVMGVSVPFECEVLTKPRRPLTGLSIEIDVSALRGVVERVADRAPTPTASPDGPRALTTVDMDDTFRGVAARLASALHDPLDAHVLGPGLLDELLYRLLRTPAQSALRPLAFSQSPEARISRSTARIRRELAEPLSVEALAADVGMSKSTYHRTFRAVTGHSPLRYLKQMRLHRAWGLIVFGGVRASEAAYEVGYRSPSQFSREFQRLFGVSPSRAATEGSPWPTEVEHPPALTL